MGELISGYPARVPVLAASDDSGCGVCVCAQDVGGQDSIRPLWRHYFTGSQALIYVVDSHDRARIDKAKLEFDRIVNDRAMTDVSDLPGGPNR